MRSEAGSGSRPGRARLAKRAHFRVPRATRLSPRSLKRPTLRLAIEINNSVRETDEWFDEPDDLDRVERALSSIDYGENPLVAAGSLACRVTRAQGFAEGNKRTALLLERWALDHNGVDGSRTLPSDDFVLADLLVQAASGTDAEEEIVSRLQSQS